VALEAVFLDVGETLVNEERYWRQVAAVAGLDVHVVLAALGVTIARGEDHTELWSHLGRPKPEAVAEVVYELEDLYSDALPCLELLRARGLRVGIAGNQSEALERWTRAAGFPVSVIGSSATWGVRKPAPGFFRRMVVEAGGEADRLAYVGDRVDNDVLPALEAGIVAVHLRRGPWGRLQASPPGAVSIDSLAELAEALASLS
jgi:FMN phosphatase YigB (HAD superfamily)